MKIAVIGSGDLGKQMVHFIQMDTSDEVVCFFDDFKVVGEDVLNIPIKGGIKDVVASYAKGEFDQIICAIGYNHLKEKERICTSLMVQGIPFYSFIHSSAVVDKTAEIKEGSFIYPGCIIDQRVKVLEHTIVNLGTIISHDSIVGKSCFLAPNVAIAGFTTVGNCCNIGISSTIIDNLRINNNVIVGAGSLVLKSIVEEGTFVGSPCYKIK